MSKTLLAFFGLLVTGSCLRVWVCDWISNSKSWKISIQTFSHCPMRLSLFCTFFSRMWSLSFHSDSHMTLHMRKKKNRSCIFIGQSLIWIWVSLHFAIIGIYFEMTYSKIWQLCAMLILGLIYTVRCNNGHPISTFTRLYKM